MKTNLVKFKRDYIVYNVKNSLHNEFVFKGGYSYISEYDGMYWFIYNIDRSIVAMFNHYDMEKYIENYERL